MVFTIGGVLGVIGVLLALRWVARTDAAVIAGVFKNLIRNLIRIGLMSIGMWLVGGRYFLAGLLLNRLFSRRSGQQRTGSRQSGQKSREQTMSVSQARQILKVGPLANDEDITQAWRKLMRSAHPDMGGKPEDAVLINQARDILLKNR